MTRIAVAGFRPDGKVHVEVIAQRAGHEWVIPWLESPDRTFKPGSVTWQIAGAPVASLTDDFEKSSLPLVKWGGSDLGRASGLIYDLVTQVDDLEQPNPGVFHRPQPTLDVAANTAVVKPSGDSWLWDRSKSPADISALVAATAAVWALLNKEVVPVSSAYDAGASVMML